MGKIAPFLFLLFGFGSIIFSFFPLILGGLSPDAHIYVRIFSFVGFFGGIYLVYLGTKYFKN